jgi:hypothetical protein
MAASDRRLPPLLCGSDAGSANFAPSEEDANALSSRRKTRSLQAATPVLRLPQDF